MIIKTGEYGFDQASDTCWAGPAIPIRGRKVGNAPAMMAESPYLSSFRRLDEPLEERVPQARYLGCLHCEARRRSKDCSCQ